MNQPVNTCVDRAFYEQVYPGSSFEEARAVLIGRFFEKELEKENETKLKAHLQKCDCCTQFLGELEKIAEFKATPNPVPYAVCPSNEEMDIYAFDREGLSSQDAKRIEAHLQECPLCQDEFEWLKNLERGKILEIAPPQRKRTFSPLLHYASMAAAIVFFILTAFLWWQKTSTSMPGDQLRALAHVKEPNEIDFASLDKTSPVLTSDEQPIYLEAVRSFKEGDFQKAIGLFEKVLADNPRHSASLFLLGYSYYKLNQLDKAFALCDRAESIHPHSYERCMSLVHIALKTGHYERAIKEIDALYHNVPQNAEVNELYHEISRITHGRTLKL